MVSIHPVYFPSFLLRFVLAWCTWMLLAASVAAQTPEPESPALQADAEASGAVRVVVRVETPAAAEGLLTSPEAKAQRASIARVQENVIALTEKGDALHRFRRIPYVLLAATPGDLERLAASPFVASVQRDFAVPMLGDANRLEESTAIVGAPEAWARGFDGAGTEVAILDSGVEADHPFLAGRVVGEACFSSTSSSDGYTSFTLCPDGEETQIGPGAGAPCDLARGCDHGTFVAGIVAGSGVKASGGVGKASGVAPGVGIHSLQVKSRFTEGCTAECGLTWYSDHLRALEYVYELVVENGRPIVAANLSFGGGSYPGVCDDDVPAMRDAVENLLSVGVATVIASGNGREPNATTYPGCISSAITVGATTKEDAVWDRSNVAPWMDLLAPGTGILTSTLGGGFDVGNGTSMATPHVVGAWAILRQRFPQDGVAETLARLQASGVGIAAGVPEALYPRIQIDAALDAPRLAYAPGSVTQVLASGETAVQTVTLTNSAEAGSPDLAWSASVEGGGTWASVSASPEPLAPEASGAVTVAFDASGLAAGTYTATLVLTSSDPTAASATAPLTLHVGAETQARQITGGAGWRLLAPAAPGVTVDELAALNLVSGVPGYYPENAAPNLYARHGASGYAPVGAGDVLASGRAFWWYVYDLNFTDGGPSDSYTLPTTLATPRAPLATDAEVPIYARGGWNLLGNPFGVPLSLADVMAWPGAAQTLASPTASVYDDATNSWALTTTGAEIQPWQGFLLYGARTGTLTIPASAQVSGAASASGAAQADERVFLAFELSETPEADMQPLADRGAVLYFDDEAAGRWSVPQLHPMDSRYVMAAFESESGLQAQEAHKPLAPGERVEAALAVRAVGSARVLTLTWPSLHRLPQAWQVLLRDTQTGETVDLRAEPSYRFEVRPEAAASRRAPEAAVPSAKASGVTARFAVTLSHGAATGTAPEATRALHLSPPVPNPARGLAQIRYTLPATGAVRLNVVDLLGRRVASLVDADLAAGAQTAQVDTRTLAAGVYAVRLQHGDAVRVVRMTVVR